MYIVTIELEGRIIGKVGTKEQACEFAEKYQSIPNVKIAIKEI